MRIGIVGNGVVGGALAQVFNCKGHTVAIHDKEPTRSNVSVAVAIMSDLCFVCLPTPQKVGSLECDTSALDEFFNFVRGVSNTHFVLKSTVPVGTTRRLKRQYDLPDIVHSPEFLTARTAVEDAANPRINVIGTPGGFVGDYGLLSQFYVEAWPEVRCLNVSSDESETIKLVQNAHSAVEVAFWNEVFSYCLLAGLGYDTILSALLTQGWVLPTHSQVPGPDGRRGFGGSCLPKDLCNLITCLGEAGCENPVLTAAKFRNDNIDRVGISGHFSLSPIPPEVWSAGERSES